MKIKISWPLTFSPEFYCSEGNPEALLIGYEAEDSVGYPATVEATHTALVEVSKKSLVQEIEITRDSRKSQTSKQQIHLQK